MQETTLFAQDSRKEAISDSAEERGSSPVQRNGGAVINKRCVTSGTSPVTNNGRLNTAYKGELSSDEDNT